MVKRQRPGADEESRGVVTTTSKPTAWNALLLTILITLPLAAIMAEAYFSWMISDDEIWAVIKQKQMKAAEKVIQSPVFAHGIYGSAEEYRQQISDRLENKKASLVRKQREILEQEKPTRVFTRTGLFWGVSLILFAGLSFRSGGWYVAMVVAALSLLVVAGVSVYYVWNERATSFEQKIFIARGAACALYIALFVVLLLQPVRAYLTNPPLGRAKLNAYALKLYQVCAQDIAWAKAVSASGSLLALTNAIPHMPLLPDDQKDSLLSDCRPEEHHAQTQDQPARVSPDALSLSVVPVLEELVSRSDDELVVTGAENALAILRPRRDDS